jgi:hypothetical protein
MGRPSDYTEETATAICERMMEGRSLNSICNDDDMPNRSTVVRWQVQHEDFAARCARARELQADLMDDMILDAAKACTAETALADRIKISAYQWRASKLQPKRYGDKVQTEHSGSVSISYEDALTQLGKE